ncbi:MAG: integrin alpha [Phycisphaerae bacterium]
MIAGAYDSTRAQFVEADLTIIHTLVGDGSGEFFGYVANSIDDVDGDGVRDILNGAPFSSFEGANAGRAYLNSGASGARLHVFAGNPGDYLGASVNDAGDLNNDGVHDIILGGAGQPFNASPGVNGRVVVYSGQSPYPELWSVNGEALNDQFGYSVAGLMDDVNNDGFFDVLATAPQHDTSGVNAGRAYILSGLDGAVLQTYDGVFTADNHGTAVESIGDIDGDGIRDVVVGARNAGNPRRGRVYVYSSAMGTLIHTLVPDNSAIDFGWFFMNSAGDADGDAYDDIYVSDFADGVLGATTGKAYLFSGKTGLKIRHWQGASAQQGFGIGRAVPDANNDDRADVYVAAWVGDAGALNAGQGFLLSGRDGSVLQTMTCNIANTQAGYDAHGVGDVNGDGRPDFVLTGQGDSPANIAAGNGVAYVLGGQVGGLRGDMNCDGVVSVSDIGGFVLALTDAAGYAAQFPDCEIHNADVNGDKAVSVSDIGEFVALLVQ